MNYKQVKLCDLKTLIKDEKIDISKLILRNEYIDIIDGFDNEYIDIKRVAYKIDNIKIKNDVIYGDILILNTVYGNILKTILMLNDSRKSKLDYILYNKKSDFWLKINTYYKFVKTGIEIKRFVILSHGAKI